MDFTEGYYIFEINGIEYLCEKKIIGEIYHITVCCHNETYLSHSIGYEVYGKNYRINTKTFTSENIESNMKVIYEEDILSRTMPNLFLEIKSLTPDFYTSPTYDSEGVKPAKMEE